MIGFPEGFGYSLLKGYLYSENLRWSYTAIDFRTSSNWQKEVITLDPNKFIYELKKAGFRGVYLDKGVINHMASETDKVSYMKKYAKIEKNLRKISKNTIYSGNQIVFFEI